MPQRRLNNKKLNLSLAQELKILRAVADIASADMDLNLGLHLVVKIVTETTGADSVFIYLFDVKKENLVLMASKTRHKKELGHLELKVGEGITGWVARENKTVAIKNHAYKDPGSRISMFCRKTGMRRFCPCLLYIRERRSASSMSSTSAGRITRPRRSICWR